MSFVRIFPLAIAGLLAAALALPVYAAPMNAYIKIDDIDGEALAASTNEIERQFNELSHVVQQGGGRSGVEAAGIADRIIAETRELEKLYSAPQHKEGKRYARALAADAKKIRQQAQRLGSAPSPEAQAAFQKRVSEVLRHKDRTLAAHMRWATGLAAQSYRQQSQPAGAGQPAAPRAGEATSGGRSGNRELEWKIEEGGKSTRPAGPRRVVEPQKDDSDEDHSAGDEHEVEYDIAAGV